MDCSDVKIIDFKELGDERGNLVVVEGNKDIPFEIKRIFYIYGLEGNAIRGQHANKKTEFVLINVAGSCEVKIDDGKGNTDIIVLDKPCTGVYIPKPLWKEMYNFSEDAVLLCLASEHYDGQEYIRDYEEYIQYMKQM